MIPISGFTNTDTIDVTDFAATSATFAANTLTLSNATTSTSLDMVGSFAANSFRVSSDGQTGSFIGVGRTISGTSDTGITLTDTLDNPVFVTGTIDVTSGNALYGQNGAGYTWTIDNSGLISGGGSGEFGRGIRLGSTSNTVTDALVVNDPRGQIAGYGSGVEIYGTGTVVNRATGTIQATEYGVDLQDVGTVENFGVVTASSNAAVATHSGGLITNATGGILLSSGGLGVEDVGTGAGIALTVINAGAITSGLDGVLIQSPGTVDNMAGGTIQGLQSNGVDAFAAGTIVNDGTVTARFAAIEARSGGRITNAIGGTLSGGYEGVSADGTETVTNAGVITGHYGVLISGPGVVVNSTGGIIHATQRDGVNAQTGTVTNYGTIISGAASTTNAASGLLAGGSVGVSFYQGPIDAVVFSEDDLANRVIAGPGASFVGNVDGGTGTFELAVGNGSTDTLTGIGSTITNFSALQFDTGAKWEIAGQTGTAGFDTIAINGFANFDTIDVTDFRATSATFADNVLTLTGTGTTSATLNILGSFAPDAFHVSTDGKGRRVRNGRHDHLRHP
jgi:hypothetical protein